MLVFKGNYILNITLTICHKNTTLMPVIAISVV